MLSFGELLRQFRTGGGFSQEFLAGRARLSREAVSALERGARRAPYRVTVALLADALGLSADQHAALELAAARGRARTASESPTPGEPRHNLPLQLTSFVGRERELGDLIALLAKHRLVTVTGSGGIGKTRVALEVAARILPTRGEEIWFVDLSALNDGALTASKIASVMEIVFDARGDPAVELARSLRGRKLLLVLDNCGHVISHVAEVARVILQSCRTVAMFATSRERIGIAGEATYRIAPLPESTAISLFTDRTVLVEPLFRLTPKRAEIVADICRRLDCIPLAIELTAARLPAFGLSGLGDRLTEMRQRTMLGTIEWSYNLLSEPERALLRRLAIFAGGMTLEAAQSVCAGEELDAVAVPDILSSLADKSLVNVVLDEEGARYCLFEAIRTFGLERLAAAGETTLLARRHAQWVAVFADRAGVAYGNTPRSAWLARCLPEFDNIRAALEWALGSDAEDDGVIAGRIAGGLRMLWYLSGNYYESTRWVEAALERVDEVRYPDVVAQLLHAKLLLRSGFVEPALIERAAALYDRVGDPLGTAYLYTTVGNNLLVRGNVEEAESALARASQVFREEDHRHDLQYAAFINSRAFLRIRQERFEEARADIDELTALGESSGEEAFVLHALRWRSIVAFCGDDVTQAIRLAEEALDRSNGRAAFSELEAFILCELAGYKLVFGDVDGAESAGKEALDRARGGRRQSILSIIRMADVLAAVAAVRGHLRVAARLLGFLEATYWSKGIVRGLLDRQIYEILLASLREQLSQAQIDALAAEGAMLSVEAAAELALAAN